MSATGRSDVRRESDHYITPEWCVQRFLEAYDLPLDAVVLDPCAANGELLSVVRKYRPDVETYGIELRPECMAPLTELLGERATIGNFLELSKQLPDKTVDVILTNFPFSLADEFLAESRRVAKVTITLQRINWLRGNGRQNVMRKAHPGLFVLPDRPSFTGRGTDATEYAFFCFDDSSYIGRWEMLAETPEEERLAWNKRARVLHPVEKNEEGQKENAA